MTDQTGTHYTQSAAEPVRFVLLGLLLDNPAHGYDLARLFAPASTLGDVVHLSVSQLYALLARLERDGLITGQTQDAGHRPQRRVYRLTEVGRDAVERWIDEPVSHPRDMRIDFPLKLYLARSKGAERVAALVARQRVVFQEYIARLQEEEDRPTDVAADAAFLRLMRAGRIGRAEAALDWLSQCLTLPDLVS